MNAEKTRVAFIACSGGGLIDAFANAAAEGIVRATCVGVVTDRPCKAECVAVKNGMDWRRAIGADRTKAWSERVSRTLEEWGAEVVVLLFLRKVGKAIWGNSQWKTWNLHPSLLPDFKGIGALEENYETATTGKGDGWMGVTLHEVCDALDGGQAIAQARYQVGEVHTLEQATHASYLFKLALLMECVNGVNAIARKIDFDAAGWQGRYRGISLSQHVMRCVEHFAQPWALGMLRGTLAEAPR